MGSETSSLQTESDCDSIDAAANINKARTPVSPETPQTPEAPKVLYKTSRTESIGQYGGKVTDCGLVHGEESVMIRLELWLGNAMLTIDG